MTKDQPGSVTVEQCDRDAAAKIALWLIGRDAALDYRAGKTDKKPLTQAFAHHRRYHYAQPVHHSWSCFCVTCGHKWMHYD